MKRCKTCGKLNEDDALVCENCHFEFETNALVSYKENEEEKSILLTLGAGILILVGIIFLVIDLVHLRFSSLTILYLISGINLFIFRFYQDQNDSKVALLNIEIDRLKEAIEKLNQKNAD